MNTRAVFVQSYDKKSKRTNRYGVSTPVHPIQTDVSSATAITQVVTTHKDTIRELAKR